MRFSSIAFSITLFAWVVACAEAPSEAQVETWQTGALIDGANGLQVGPDGNLYVASVVTPGIFVIDPSTGEVVERKQVDGPDDVAFGPDGVLCWTSILTGEVGCERGDGVRITAAKLTPGVNPITFADDGRLFVSQCFFDDKLYEVDPTGATDARLIRDDLGPGCGLNGMDWGPDDKLYGPRWFVGSVVRIDVDSGEMQTIAEGFATPAAVKFDPDGVLHVLDTGVGKIFRLGDDGARHLVADLTPGMDNFDFAPDGRLFASSFTDGYVTQVSSVSENRLITPAGVSMPNGLAVVGDELVVADFFSVKKYAIDSGEPTEVIRDVIGFSDLGTVTSLHAGPGGLVLASWNDQTIKLWDPVADSLIRTFENRGRPIDAIQMGEHIVYSEFDSRSVRRLAIDGSGDDDILLTIDGIPAGLAVDGESIYIGDFATGRILLLDGDVFAEGLSEPEGLIVHDGTLYVVENGSRRLIAFDLATKERRTVASDLAIGTPAQTGLPPTMLFSGIAADAAGRLYVGGEADNVIYRISP